MSASPAQGLDTRRVAKSQRRLGAAVVELAVLLPLLVLIFILTIDFARVYYCSLSLMNCARAGALYACDPTTTAESPFASAQAAALADATNLNPQPTVTSVSGVDAQGRAYVTVTASYVFQTITGFPGLPAQVPLQRSVTMFQAAGTPSSN